MKSIRLFIFSSLFILGMSLIGVYGCGGGSSTNPSGETGGETPPPPPVESKMLVFASNRALDGTDNQITNDITNIWTMNAEATKLQPLTLLLNADNINPNWSPDRTKIVFTSNRALDGTDALNTNKVSNIWVMNADGTNVHPLTKQTLASNIYPSWSPDGTKIAFTSNRAFDGSDALNPNKVLNIWIMDVNGANLQIHAKTTVNGTDSFSPIWSPDGTKLAFYSSRALDGSDTQNTNRSTNIWISDANGLNPLTRLTKAGAYYPVWSPDGMKIAFTSSRAADGSDTENTNGVSNIWIMNANGSNPQPLTKLTNADSNYSGWFSNKTKLVYVSNRALDGSDGKNPAAVYNLWTINIDGSNDQALTKLLNTSIFNPGF